MSFAQPGFLLGLAIVPVAVLFLFWVSRSRRKALARLGDPALIQRLAASANAPGRRLKQLLWLAALTLGIIALARPQWGEAPQMVEQEGIQVMVALDVSNSMMAEDVTPNRLLRAKRDITDLMDRLDGDEIGLVVFSGAAFVQFPLTSDYATASSFLESANPGIISRQGTAIGEAIATALGGFDTNSSAQKVIIIFTDGENHESDTLAAAQAAADQGVILYLIGFGSEEGATIPLYDAAGNLTGYKTDVNGQVVQTRLDEATLQQMAEISGGQYFRATDGSELNALVAELGNLQTGRFESRETRTLIERFQLFLLAAVVALLLAEIVPERRNIRRPRVTNALGRTVRNER
jgi:Ca-activated chloride channel family protein